MPDGTWPRRAIKKEERKNLEKEKMRHKRIKANFVDYVGNGAYCYANSASMLLASIGEKVSPSIIEVLCGIGLSAFWMAKNNLIFFNFALPDEELTRAFKILGFDCKERIVSKKKFVPIEKLKKDLKESPVLIGPVDMGYLIYNPNYRFLGGADHFVLAYDFDNENIYLHDPEKFPCVSLSFKQLKLSWKSKRIFYGLENYRYWTAPKRIKKPSQKEIYDQAMKDFKSIYRNRKIKSAKNNWITGKEAILTCAERFRKQKSSKEEIGQLIYFALPLGAKRALDFAAFFDFRDKNLAALKRKQARVFGKCHSLAMLEKWPLLADALQQLADIEENIQTEITKTA